MTFKNVVKNHWVEKEPDVVGAPPPYAVGTDEKAGVAARRMDPSPSSSSSSLTHSRPSISSIHTRPTENLSPSTRRLVFKDASLTHR